jgi:hypothetical protein
MQQQQLGPIHNRLRIYGLRQQELWSLNQPMIGIKARFRAFSLGEWKYCNPRE